MLDSLLAAISKIVNWGISWMVPNIQISKIANEEFYYFSLQKIIQFVITLPMFLCFVGSQMFRVFPKLYKVDNKGLRGKNKLNSTKNIASSGDRNQDLLVFTLMPCLQEISELDFASRTTAYFRLRSFPESIDLEHDFIKLLTIQTDNQIST